jgi:hypothetical protein
MRIVYILLSPTFGMHQYTADLANRLATDEAWLEAEVHLVTTTNLPADRYAPAVRIHTPLTTQNTGLSLDSLRLDKLARVKATLRELRPDLVHFTGPHLWNVASCAGCAAREFRPFTPCTISIRTPAAPMAGSCRAGTRR